MSSMGDLDVELRERADSLARADVALELLGVVREALGGLSQQVEELERMLSTDHPRKLAGLYRQVTRARTAADLVEAVQQALQDYDSGHRIAETVDGWRAWMSLAAELADVQPDLSVLLWAAARRAPRLTR